MHNGVTALMIAIMKQQMEVVKALINCNRIDLNIQDHVSKQYHLNMIHLLCYTLYDMDNIINKYILL